MSAATVATPIRERPILMAGPMVRAIFDGRKTQTRRGIKSLAHFGSAPTRFWEHADLSRAWVDGKGSSYQYLHVPSHKVPRCAECRRMGWEGTAHRLWCDVAPHGAMSGYPGHLWVREKWTVIDHDFGTPPSAWLIGYDQESGWHSPPREVRNQVALKFGTADTHGGPDPKWRSPIHMHRWASRLTLEVTEVRVQRLQEISGEDAKAEGVERHRHGWRDYLRPDGLPQGSSIDSFCTAWDSINGKRAPWSSNPWVWAISFQRAA